MLKKKTSLIGLILTAVLALCCLILTLQFFQSPHPDAASLFHAGVDLLGAFVCVVLFYGSMGQVERATRSFSALILMVSASFAVNAAMWFIVGSPQRRMLYFLCCLLSKWINLAMIYAFFLYVKETLRFEGRLARWAVRGFPILLIASVVIVSLNALFPLSFLVDADGLYSKTSLSWLEDLYLIVVSVVTTVLIVRCASPRRQKWAAMSFILVPIAEFAASGGAFAYATQYGSVLLSLILMYCILFNDRSRRLAATQTELAMATQIQEAMLPTIFPAFPERAEFDVYASMDPAKEVGGDFYDFFLIDEDHLGLIIADVSGKGVPAALFMMISKTILQNYAKLGLSAGEILSRTNAALCSENKTDMFVTTWVGILEIPSGKMTCANAGHEYPAVCREGRFELLKDKHGFVLGGMDGSRYREYELQLQKGDKIFVYTDGVPEATNGENELFGTERMLGALNQNAAASPKELLAEVRRDVDAFVGSAEQFDDLTMLSMEYRGAPEKEP